MGDDTGGHEFRARATRVYRAVCVVLVVGAVAAGWFGWWVGGGIGLAVGAGLGGVLAGAGWFAATLLWAMSQDGG